MSPAAKLMHERVLRIRAKEAEKRRRDGELIAESKCVLVKAKVDGDL